MDREDGGPLQRMEDRRRGQGMDEEYGGQRQRTQRTVVQNRGWIERTEHGCSGWRTEDGDRGWMKSMEDRDRGPRELLCRIEDGCRGRLQKMEDRRRGQGMDEEYGGQR